MQSGRVETTKVHWMKPSGKNLETACGYERKFFGFVTGEKVTCKHCLKIQPN